MCVMFPLLSGELGWELYVPMEHSVAVYQALIEAGQEFEIADFGTFALNTMRLEHGFRMWGSEVRFYQLYTLGLFVFVGVLSVLGSF